MERRVIEYIWSTLLMSQQYEKLLANTHLGTQHFDNAQDMISQTFLETEQTLSMHFPFRESGSASLPRKKNCQTHLGWVAGGLPAVLGWRASSIFQAVLKEVTLCSCLYTGNQGHQCRLEHKAAAEAELTPDTARKTISSLKDGVVLYQVPASPSFSLCNSCDVVKCQSGIN